MLVLRRRAGESVLIGDEIEVELLAITQQGAKIGIRAPKETVVLRKELKITQEQNARAAEGASVVDLELAIKKLRSRTQESILLPDKHPEH
jgi:carbon storage regulator